MNINMCYDNDHLSKFVHRNTQTYREGTDDGWIRSGTQTKQYDIRYAKKSYQMPSGKIIWIQGLENKALDILLNEYKESDIIVNDDQIARMTCKFYYIGLDKKIHLYIPDIYIVSERCVIEVKSPFTYKIQLKINKLKEQAVLAAGYRFKFMIL